EDEGVDVVGIGERAERVAKLRVAFEGQRVLALGPVELDHGDAALRAPEEMLRLQAGHAGQCSPSQLLRKARSMPDSRRASSSPTEPRSSAIHPSCARAMRSNAAMPCSVSRTIEARRSPSRLARTTRPSATRRSTMPVTLPLETSRKRDRSLISMPSGAR